MLQCIEADLCVLYVDNTCGHPTVGLGDPESAVLSIVTCIATAVLVGMYVVCSSFGTSEDVITDFVGYALCFRTEVHPLKIYTCAWSQAMVYMSSLYLGGFHSLCY